MEYTAKGVCAKLGRKTEERLYILLNTMVVVTEIIKELRVW